MLHKGIQGNLEGESNSLSEVTLGFFFLGNPSIRLLLLIRVPWYNVYVVVKFYPWFNFDFPLFDIHYHI